MLCNALLLHKRRECEITIILRVRDFSLYNQHAILWIVYITTKVVNPSCFTVSHRCAKLQTTGSCYLLNASPLCTDFFEEVFATQIAFANFASFFSLVK